MFDEGGAWIRLFALHREEVIEEAQQLRALGQNGRLIKYWLFRPHVVIVHCFTKKGALVGFFFFALVVHYNTLGREIKLSDTNGSVAKKILAMGLSMFRQWTSTGIEPAPNCTRSKHTNHNSAKIRQKGVRVISFFFLKHAHKGRGASGGGGRRRRNPSIFTSSLLFKPHNWFCIIEWTFYFICIAEEVSQYFCHLFFPIKYAELKWG